MYGVTHMDGSGEDNPPVDSLSDLYDEIHSSGIFDGNVAVIHYDSHWCISAYRNGAVVFERIGEMNTERHMQSVPKKQALALWERLIRGDIQGLLAEPWRPGYGDPTHRATNSQCDAGRPAGRLPLCVRVRDRLSSAKLFRLRDGRFQIVQSGQMPVLINGPNHVLVRAELAAILIGAHPEGAQLIPAVIYDRSANHERSDYSELVLAQEITFDNIEQLDVSGLKMWRFKLEHTLHVFVSPDLKDRLVAEGLSMLEYSPGFSQFGG